MTPIQLWFNCLNCYDNEASTSEANMDGPLPSQRYDNEKWNDFHVTVSTIACPLNDTQLNSLATAIDPLGSSSTYGVDIYLNAG